MGLIGISYPCIVLAVPSEYRDLLGIIWTISTFGSFAAICANWVMWHTILCRRTKESKWRIIETFRRRVVRDWEAYQQLTFDLEYEPYPLDPSEHIFADSPELTEEVLAPIHDTIQYSPEEEGLRCRDRFAA
jgi:hypothetical protein